ncbi:MAG: HU family DNA-binding protein [Prevotella sp.]|uniref:HU family DNA-binding protein n=1 Tax=Prevotella sp. AGR2160 TaxID=1280674 RepID=UPI000400F98A|nr:HU family DNA-binding protein [Prevotella sp. AGR2160]MDD5861983.1 HU family DNA-binding protein [Prevotella sp.]
MTKADIINEVAEATGMSKKEVTAVVESFMETVKGHMIKKESVFLRGFGSFIIKHRAEKTARNISKNTTMVIPAHDLPAFKPAKSFMEEMR